MFKLLANNLFASKFNFNSISTFNNCVPLQNSFQPLVLNCFYKHAKHGKIKKSPGKPQKYKLKTKKAAQKRFRVTSNGKLRYRSSGKVTKTIVNWKSLGSKKGFMKKNLPNAKRSR